MLFSEGVLKERRITLEQFVDITATRPARIYGLHPRKGTIAVGADADIAIWDTEREVTISADMLHDNMDYTPYEGRRITGWPVTTLSRGEVVWNGSEPMGEPGPRPVPGMRFSRCREAQGRVRLGLRSGDRRIRATD